MTAQRRPEVGDRVILKPIGNNARNRKPTDLNYLRYGTVVSARRTLFGVQMDGWRDTTDFYFDSMCDKNGQYTSNWRAYFSEQEIADERRAVELARAIRERFRYNPKVTLDQLERIVAILDER